MLSYIVGFIAAVVFLANPLSQLLLPDREARTGGISQRPKLNESLLAIDGANSTAPECGRDVYVARILNREPLVVYLEGFLSDDERVELLDVSEALFKPSTITHNGEATHRDTTVRDSQVAVVPRTNSIRCIERRAKSLQGWRQDLWIERLRTQRYGPGGHYNHHFDWSVNTGGWGRVSSIMAWVDAAEGLRGGGTEFPLLRKPGGEEGKEWCRFIECDDSRVVDEDGDKRMDQGVVFKVIPGNAVYWENFAGDGRGYDETWHAGLPVEEGIKVGLNIWSFGRIY